jgi:hypothetical protein
MVMFVVQMLGLSFPLLPGLHDWLSSTDNARPADLIFVLAGRMSRKDYALQLFREGLAPRLLFSVGRFEMRRFSKMALPMQLESKTSSKAYFLFAWIGLTTGGIRKSRS